MDREAWGTDSWGRKESDTTERLNWIELKHYHMWPLSTWNVRPRNWLLNFSFNYFKFPRLHLTRSFHTEHWVGFPSGSDSKESMCDAADQVRSLSWKDPWRREWLPTPIFLSGKPHGQRSLAGQRNSLQGSWSCRELDVTERLTCTHTSPTVSTIHQIWVWASTLPQIFSTIFTLRFSDHYPSLHQ